MSSRKTEVLVALLVLCAAAPAAANLLVNPTFAGSASPWTGAGTFDATPANSHTADGSGSLVSTLINSSGTNTSIGAGTSQCVSGIVAGTTYGFGGFASLIPPSPGTQSGGAELSVQWFSDAACTTFITQSSGVAFTNQFLPDNTYTAMNGTATAPATALSALLVLSVLNNTPGPSTFTVRFDDMQFDVAPVAEVPALGITELALLGVLLAATALAVLRLRS